MTESQRRRITDLSMDAVRATLQERRLVPLALIASDPADPAWTCIVPCGPGIPERDVLRLLVLMGEQAARDLADLAHAKGD